MTAVLFLILGLLLWVVYPRVRPGASWVCPVLALALPFAAGGFHTATAGVLSAFLLLALWERRQKLCFHGNRHTAAVLLVFAACCLTPLWAADKGMAAFGIVRFLPPVLFALLAMADPSVPEDTLKWIPFSGCLMTVLSLVLLPLLPETMTVNGRLAGFFQYPNSFAAFLLCGLVLRGMGQKQRWDLPVYLILMMGIVLSGSKTVFVLTVAAVLAMAVLRRQKWLTLALSLAIGLGAGLLAEHLGLLHQADRFTQVSASSGTFLVRLLYYRDVLPAILKHPFGMGYLSYPAIQGTIQTGRYSVTYLHNGLLQLLLDYGWLPGIAMAVSLATGLLRRNTDPGKRLMLLFLLAHCLLDFDLEFPIFWLLLLCCLELKAGKPRKLKNWALLPLSLVLLMALWLGTGDGLYRLGKTEACLKLTPFHTQALTQKLTEADDAQQVDALADRILALCPTHSVACSAKANAAFARGDMLAMMRHKENAIRYAPYTQEEYLDYFRKLYTAMELYLRAGDEKSALYCRDKLLTIPDLIAGTAQRTTALAHKTGDDPTITLPQEYTEVLRLLEEGTG